MTAPRPPATPWSLTAYRAAAGIISPLAGAMLKARARRGKEDPDRLRERLGHASLARPAGPLAWMHAVSVGESLSLLPLIAALRAERPDLAILVTSGTQAAAEILAHRLPAGALHQYAPVDTPAAVRRFVRHWRPDVGLFVESELWPNLILAARRTGTRLALISARMTEKSAKGWAARPAAARAMLASFELILAQDAATGRRLTELGGAVSGRLNLKRLGEPLPADPDELADLKALLAGRRVVVAASTHRGEEALIAGAAAAMSPRPLTLIVPRHPELSSDIAHDLAEHRFAVRSAGEAIEPETEVYLADTLGEMGLFLRLADLVVMGGGFGQGVGGHNPLEAARLGVGVITGPDIANHADAFEAMAEAGAAIVVADGQALTLVLAALLGDPERLAAFNAAARDVAGRQGDQLAAALDLIRPLLPAA
ncbi:MAG TPA: glycosyltransferase N-terminal domain-containing protein [Caulobacteraceae bacterium]|jgi:3-deoxy-D-manno-octulosonic-acid transferase|nr:glycosyltransferase N-terminal domain-containing protein [Caulobacteraceae bacterium]